MATDWGSIAQTTIGILGGGGVGGVVGAWLNGRRQARTERSQRRDRAAETLAEARALLVDANPDRLGINASEATFEQTFTALRDRWERIRIQLLTLAAGHPSRRVCDLARQLEVEMANGLTQAQWLVSDLLKGRDLEAREVANKHHAEALKLLDELDEAIRRA
jgi:hypothetical protein